MEELFAKFVELFAKCGWVVCLIALVGIIILGVLKYTNCFKKIDEKYRHYIYIGISMILSLGGTAIYLACTKQFNINVFFGLGAIIWAINQGAYNLFKTFEIKELFIKLLDLIKKILTERNCPKDGEEKK